MISLPLFQRNMAQSWKLLVILLAVLVLYAWVIIYMYDPALASMLDDYQQAMPQMMAAMGMTGIAGNLTEFLYIYLYGFLLLVFPLILGLALSGRLISRYLDDGSMAVLLATPNSRLKIILTQALSLILCLTLLLAANTWISILLCQYLFPGELDIPAFWVLNGALLLLQLMLSGIAFLASCSFPDSRQSLFVGGGLSALFFLFQMLGNMGGKLDFFRYLTPFSLFPGERITQGTGGAGPYCLIMAAAACVFYGCGVWIFTRRDLSL